MDKKLVFYQGGLYLVESSDDKYIIRGTDIELSGEAIEFDTTNISHIEELFIGGYAAINVYVETYCPSDYDEYSLVNIKSKQIVKDLNHTDQNSEILKVPNVFLETLTNASYVEVEKFTDPILDRLEEMRETLANNLEEVYPGKVDVVLNNLDSYYYYQLYIITKYDELNLNTQPTTNYTRKIFDLYSCLTIHVAKNSGNITSDFQLLKDKFYVEEALTGVIHPHATGLFVTSGFCMGRSYLAKTIESDLTNKKIVEDYQHILMSLDYLSVNMKNYLEIESIEGGPYNKTELEILKVRRAFINNSHSSTNPASFPNIAGMFNNLGESSEDELGNVYLKQTDVGGDVPLLTINSVDFLLPQVRNIVEGVDLTRSDTKILHTTYGNIPTNYSIEAIKQKVATAMRSLDMGTRSGFKFKGEEIMGNKKETVEGFLTRVGIDTEVEEELQEYNYAPELSKVKQGINFLINR